MLQDQRDPPVSRIESQERYRCAKRGNLRMFFGGSGGMTAVRTMLETAKAAQQAGIDIVIGPDQDRVGIGVPRHVGGASLL